MPTFADGSSPEASGTVGDVEADWEVVCPGTVLVELTGPPLVATGGMVVAVLVGVDALRVSLRVVLVGVDALRVPLRVELTALIVSVVLVGVNALGVPLGVELTVLIVAVMPLGVVLTALTSVSRLMVSVKN